MKKFRSFLITTFLGGFLVVLPIIIMGYVVNWLYHLILYNIEPLTTIIIKTLKLDDSIASLIAIAIILLLFFLIGLAVRTTFGRFLYHSFENNVLKKIPGYKLIKETVSQLAGKNKNLFSSVALVNLYGNETLLTAFVTEEHSDGSYSVFIPSSPAPTAGFVYHLKKEQVHIIDIPVEQAMKTVISLGSGSSPLIEAYKKSLKK